MAAKQPDSAPDSSRATHLRAEELRWYCDPDSLGFETTEDVEPVSNVVGQEAAITALQFGLQVNAPGQNVFVRGLEGSGRLTLLRRMLEETRLACPISPDRCAVRNFEDPDRPRLIELPRGTARRFGLAVQDLVQFMVEDLGPALGGEALRARREAMEATFESTMQAIIGPFEARLEDLDLALATITAGSAQHPAIVPRIDGEPVMPEAYDTAVDEGRVSAEERDRMIGLITEATPELEVLSIEVEKLQHAHQTRLRQFIQSEARALLAGRAARVVTEFDYDVARVFLDGVIEDYVEHRLGREAFGPQELHRLYAVNVVVSHRDESSCPVVAETAPTLQNLLGVIDPELTPDGGMRTDHTRIRAGSLLRASGGFLLIEAKDILEEPGAWRVLMRTLRTGTVEIVPPELSGNMPASLKPEPAPVDLKVVLIGDAGMYYALEDLDPDFSSQFKVLADFESTLSIKDGGVNLYAGVLARIVRVKQLPPIHKTGLAMLAEYGARIAARNDQLTARFGRVVDLLYEAAFHVERDGGDVIDGPAVERAIGAMRERAGSPSRRFLKAIGEGTLRIETSGTRVGQINGLAVIQAGPLTYGFPSRITGTVGPGEGGAVNIEEQAKLSGSIHTKGFYILGGLMRHLLRTDHPLTFSASIAFEQSYGGIDGDSASGAEVCCLLSALTRVPLRQDLAMTGAIDQHGAVQAVGGVTEKIEGFYDACMKLGLTGTQGVIIPNSNRRDLMLRRDVVEACARGEFHVYSVERIQDALELFTRVECGEADDEGKYPERSLLGQAMKRVCEYWEAGTGGRAGN
jgi:predicted ATP-dependent protease